MPHTKEHTKKVENCGNGINSQDVIYTRYSLKL
jgi:hypothetical protein